MQCKSAGWLGRCRHAMPLGSVSIDIAYAIARRAGVQVASIVALDHEELVVVDRQNLANALSENDRTDKKRVDLSTH